MAGAFHQFLALAHIHKAAADQIGTGQNLPVRAVDGDRNDDDAVLGQVVAVTQHHVAHIAHAVAVHHNCPGGHGIFHRHTVRGDADVLTVFGDIDILLGDIAQMLRRFGMALELLELAVYRQEILRVRQGQHQLLFLLAGVTGNVGGVHIFVDDLGAKAQQPVDDLGDGLFVAGDGTCRNDDKVIGTDLDLTVACLRHTGQRRQRLALTAGGDQHDLFRRVLVDFGDVDQHVIGCVQIAQFLCHLGVGHHTAPADSHLAPGFYRQVDDLLHAVDVGGKGRHDNAAVARLDKQAAHTLGNGLLGFGKAGALGVGGVCQQRQHTLAPVLGNGGQVGHGVAGQRRVVHLEVAGVDDHARRAGNGERQRIRDGVVDVDRLHGKAAEADLLAGSDLVENSAGGKTMLLQLIFDKTDGQACRIDRHVEFFEQVRQAADVVLMSVGDKQTLDAVLVFQHIGKIGDDQIDAEHIGVGEHKPAVH